MNTQKQRQLGRGESNLDFLPIIYLLQGSNQKVEYNTLATFFTDALYWLTFTSVTGSLFSGATEMFQNYVVLVLPLFPLIYFVSWAGIPLLHCRNSKSVVLHFVN